MQAYFAGHDHNLEHIHVPGRTPHYIISGGGSKTERPFIGKAGSRFQWPSSGFVSVELADREMAVEFLGYGTGADDNAPMYVARVPREPPPACAARSCAEIEVGGSVMTKSHQLRYFL